MNLRQALSPAFVRRQAINRGVLGGQRGWMYVGGAFWAAKILGKLLRPSPTSVSTIRLKQGQVIRVGARRPVSRRDRRAAKST